MRRKEYTSVGEEIANAVTHGVGGILGLVIWLIILGIAVKTGRMDKVIALGVFGVTLGFMYLMSTLFHSLVFTRAKKVLRIMDHSSISVFIAGTYTPFVLVSLKGGYSWLWLIGVWGLALVGVIFRIFFINKMIISIPLYLAAGWLGIALMRQLSATLPALGIAMIIWGGVFYTTGVGFYLWRKLPFNHGIWHLFVLGGTACHLAAIGMV
jgi:hemolysin III